MYHRGREVYFDDLCWTLKTRHFFANSSLLIFLIRVLLLLKVWLRFLSFVDETVWLHIIRYLTR